ncbi:MAG TPA: response regulator [Verrucomicrobiae bacterium]|nr:response regulator [Verrucomicrobiae bacterium]
MKADNVILLVEDSTEDASLVQLAFKKWGIGNPVHVATDGERAVEYLGGDGMYADRDKYPLPTLTLLDLNLPQMSGFDVLQWMSERPGLKKLPVVVLSGTKDPTHFEQAQRLGASACVAKSLDLSELYELIQHLNYFSLASDYNNSAVDWTPEPEE